MEEPTESESITPLLIKFVKSLAEFVPAVALLSGLLYVFGIAVATTIDSRLGVGNIEVSRERAITLGLLTLILLVPYGRYALNFEEYTSELESDDFKERLKSSFFIGIEPFVYTFAIFAFCIIAKMHEVSFYIIFSYFVYFLAFFTGAVFKMHSVSVLASTSKWLALIFPFLIMGTVAPLLPMSYGGHQGPKVNIKFSDQPDLGGQIRVMDNRVIVIEADNKLSAVLRETIDSIESNSAISVTQ